MVLHFSQTFNFSLYSEDKSAWVFVQRNHRQKKRKKINPTVLNRFIANLCWKYIIVLVALVLVSYPCLNINCASISPNEFDRRRWRNRCRGYKAVSLMGRRMKRGIISAKIPKMVFRLSRSSSNFQIIKSHDFHIRIKAVNHQESLTYWLIAWHSHSRFSSFPPSGLESECAEDSH